MASVLNFPSRSGAEDAMKVPYLLASAQDVQHGLRLVPESGARRRDAALDLTRMIGAVVAQIDGEMGRQSER